MRDCFSFFLYDTIFLFRGAADRNTASESDQGYEDEEKGMPPKQGVLSQASLLGS